MIKEHEVGHQVLDFFPTWSSVSTSYGYTICTVSMVKLFTDVRSLIAVGTKSGSQKTQWLFLWQFPAGFWIWQLQLFIRKLLNMLLCFYSLGVWLNVSIVLLFADRQWVWFSLLLSRYICWYGWLQSVLQWNYSTCIWVFPPTQWVFHPTQWNCYSTCIWVFPPTQWNYGLTWI